MTKSILRLPEVKRKTGLSKSSIYARISASEFPNQISIGPRAVGWLESEIQTWIEERIKCRKREATKNV